MKLVELKKACESGSMDHPLKKFLKSNGISQDKLAEKLGVYQSALNRVLNGASSPRSLKEKLDALAREWRVSQ